MEPIRMDMVVRFILPFQWMVDVYMHISIWALFLYSFVKVQLQFHTNCSHRTEIILEILLIFSIEILRKIKTQNDSIFFGSNPFTIWLNTNKQTFSMSRSFHVSAS